MEVNSFKISIAQLNNSHQAYKFSLFDDYISIHGMSHLNKNRARHSFFDKILTITHKCYQCFYINSNLIERSFGNQRLYNLHIKSQSIYPMQ